MKISKKIIIAESYPLIISGISSFFEGSSNITIVAQLDNIDILKEKISSLNPDILILDPNIAGASTPAVLKHLSILYPHLICIALLTSYVEQNILKQFKEVIELNDNKQKVLSKIYNLFNDNNLASQNESFELSGRETQVLIAVAKGMSNKEVSDKLNISVHTVMTHRKNIIKKTGIKSVSGLTVYALLNNLIEENEVV